VSGSRVRLSSPTRARSRVSRETCKLRGGSGAHLGEHVHRAVALNLRIDPSAAPQQAAVQDPAEREGHGAGRARESRGLPRQLERHEFYTRAANFGRARTTRFLACPTSEVNDRVAPLAFRAVGGAWSLRAKCAARRSGP
jgi:hypothetical protein